MAKKQIIFRLTAFSAAAGKYNPDAPLYGNEDNFYVDDDLSDDILGRFQPNEDTVMSDCGCLMVVADGMGGMNAGEVASELAIETVKDFFAPGKITTALAESPVERSKYLELVIKEADRRIKTDAKENPAHDGMGSTIILAWIVGDKMTLSWCGDSRAYRYNPLNGLEPLSRDHSYVQELVNQGVLKYEDTFEHPQGNIVTRSLGDPNNAAKPETRQFDVYNEDVILLCSDGLSGVLRDRKTKDDNGEYYPGDNIEDIIAAHTSSMTECRDALLEAAEKADWYDNVTVLLCQIESGAGEAPKKQSTPTLQEKTIDDKNTTGKKSLNTRIFLSAGAMLVLVAILCGVSFHLGVQKGIAEKGIVEKASVDSIGLLIRSLNNINEQIWMNERDTLTSELENIDSLAVRANDLVAYNRHLNDLRKLRKSLRPPYTEQADALEQKILKKEIKLTDCDSVIGRLSSFATGDAMQDSTASSVNDNTELEQ